MLRQFRLSLINPALTFSILWIISLLVLNIRKTLFFSENSFSAMPNNFSDANSQLTTTFYLIIVLLVLLFSTGKTKDIKRDYKGLNDINSRILSKISPRIIAIISVTAFLISIFHFTLIDKTKLFTNTEYLGLNDTTAFNSPSGLAQLLISLNKFISLLLAPFIVMLTRRKNSIYSFFLFTSWSYSILIFNAANSRWLLLNLIIILFVSLIFNTKWYKQVMLFSLILFCSLKIFSERWGPNQNLSSSFNGYVTVVKNFDAGVLYGVFLNIFQGSMNFATSLDIKNSPNNSYKLKSFMPTISAIDGFKNTEEIRINDFVPMNAFSQAYNFGPQYFIFYIAFTLYYIKKTTIFCLNNKGKISSIVFAIFTLLVFFFQSQYTIRTSFKLMFFTLIFLMVRKMKFRLTNEK